MAWRARACLFGDMTTLFVILACFAGVFALPFGIAGITGLTNCDPPKDRRGAFLMFVDHLVAGGLVTMCRDIGRNWTSRVEERRLLLLGLTCGVGCLIFVALASR